ncbi:lipase family protein [Oligoflexaceae bacterium]|nr:lipase family protein [Oligoflexaceae bacterium]
MANKTLIGCIFLILSSCKTVENSQLKTDFAFSRSNGEVSFLNAHQLTFLSELAYEDEGQVKSFADSFEFELDHVEDVGGTFYYIISNEDIIVLAFRGTENNLIDFWTDFKFFHKKITRGSVHCGFCKSYSIVKDKIREVVATLYKEKPRELYITGHSLGGALGNIAALDLTLYMKQFDPKFAITGLYTFGTPRVFDKEGVQFLDQNVTEHYRFIFGNDKVVQVPWVLQNYFHGGHAIRFQRSDCKLLGERKKLGPILRTLRNARDFWRPSGFEDHRLRNYRDCFIKNY